MNNEYYPQEFKDLIDKLDLLYKDKDSLDNVFDIKYESGKLLEIKKHWDGQPTVLEIKLTFDDSTMAWNFKAEAKCFIFGYGEHIIKNVENIADYNDFLNRVYRIVLNCQADNMYEIKDKELIKRMFKIFLDNVFNLMIKR